MCVLACNKLHQVPKRKSICGKHCRRFLRNESEPREGLQPQFHILRQIISRVYMKDMVNAELMFAQNEIFHICQHIVVMQTAQKTDGRSQIPLNVLLQLRCSAR